LARSQLSRFSNKQVIFAQGGKCNAVFYIQKGKVKLTVASKFGKEATIGLSNNCYIKSNVHGIPVSTQLLVLKRMSLILTTLEEI
jgi:CRP-like cAMP-binding protein